MAYWMARPYWDLVFNYEDRDPGNLNFGRPANPVDLATEINVNRMRLPDIFQVGMGVWACGEKARSVLLAAAPADFEFHPVDIRHYKTKAKVPGRFYFMNVITHRDSIVWEQSNVKIEPLPPEIGAGVIVNLNYNPATRLVMRRDKIGDAQAWHECMQKSTTRSEIFISDRLKEIMEQAGICPDSCLWAEEIYAL